MTAANSARTPAGRRTLSAVSTFGRRQCLNRTTFGMPRPRSCSTTRQTRQSPVLFLLLSPGPGRVGPAPAADGRAALVIHGRLRPGDDRSRPDGLRRRNPDRKRPDRGRRGPGRCPSVRLGTRLRTQLRRAADEVLTRGRSGRSGGRGVRRAAPRTGRRRQQARGRDVVPPLCGHGEPRAWAFQARTVAWCGRHACQTSLPHS